VRPAAVQFTMPTKERHMYRGQNSTLLLTTPSSTDKIKNKNNISLKELCYLQDTILKMAPNHLISPPMRHTMPNEVNSTGAFTLLSELNSNISALLFSSKIGLVLKKLVLSPSHHLAIAATLDHKLTSLACRNSYRDLPRP